MGKPYLDKLFRVRNTLTLVVRGKEITLHLRTISGVDESARNDYAVGRSRTILKRLREPESAESQQFFGGIDTTERPDLIEQALRLRRPTHIKAALKAAYREQDPEPPDDPTLTQVVEAVEETARLDEQVEAERATFIGNLQAAYRKQLEEMDDLALALEVREMLTDAVLNATYTQASNAYTLYAAVYTDENYRKRYFASPDEAGECDPDFASQLVDAYIVLDAFSQQPGALKN